MKNYVEKNFNSLILIALSLSLCIAMPSTSMSEEEQVNSYFPTPKGSYERIHLYPQAEFNSTKCFSGILYYNEANNNLNLCNNANQSIELSGLWKSDSSNSIWLEELTNDSSDDIFVGISTINPNTRLHIVGGQTGDYKNLIQDIFLELESSDAGGFGFSDSSSTMASSVQLNGDDLELGVSNSSSNAITLLEDGNTIFGPTFPSLTNSSKVTLSNASSSALNSGIAVRENSDPSKAVRIDDEGFQLSPTSSLTFSAGGTIEPHLHIHSSGRVGVNIETDANSSFLDINGHLRVRGGVIYGKYNTTGVSSEVSRINIKATPFIHVSSSTSDAINFQNESTTSSINMYSNDSAFRMNHGSNNQLTVNSTGVGIGATNPNWDNISDRYLLDINGDLHVDGKIIICDPDNRTACRDLDSITGTTLSGKISFDKCTESFSGAQCQVDFSKKGVSFNSAPTCVVINQSSYTADVGIRTITKDYVRFYNGENNEAVNYICMGN